MNRLGLVCALGVSLLTVACSEGDAGSPAPPSPTVTNLIVAGTVPAIGASVQFTATAQLSNGTAQGVTTQATWQSSDTNIATVSTGGSVAAVAAGAVDIRATYQGVSGFQRLTVTPLPTFTLLGILTLGSNLTPLSGVVVSILDGPNVGRTTTTDGNGFYSMGGLHGGSFTLQVSRSGYTTLTRLVTLAADGRLDLSMTATGSSGGTSLTCGSASVPSIVDCPNNQGRQAPTARCDDGSYSCSQNRSGTCSTHGGVSCFVCPGPLC